MKIELINYSGNRVECEIPEKEEILAAFIEVQSGDETLNIVTKDGEIHFFDSSDSRIENYYDGCYVVFGGPINLFDDPKWRSRKNAEDYCWQEGGAK